MAFLKKSVFITAILYATIALCNASDNTPNLVDIEPFVYEPEVTEILLCLQRELQSLNDLNILGLLGVDKITLLSGKVSLTDFKIENILDFLLENLNIKLIFIGGLGVDINASITWNKDIVLSTKQFWIEANLLQLINLKLDDAVNLNINDLSVDMFARVRLNTTGGVQIRIEKFEPTLVSGGIDISSFLSKLQIGKGSLQDVLDILAYLIDPTDKVLSGDLNKDSKMLIEESMKYVVNDIFNGGDISREFIKVHANKAINDCFATTTF